jgi:hypothetical protein
MRARVSIITTYSILLVVPDRWNGRWQKESSAARGKLLCVEVSQSGSTKGQKGVKRTLEPRANLPISTFPRPYGNGKAGFSV